METSRYDDRLSEILRKSSAVMAEKGYHRASMRDISAATGISLSGLYYYFKSKEELLFLIQEHCFGMLLDQLQAELKEVSDPRTRLERFIQLHIGFFAQSMPEMKVLSHEADSLSGEYRHRVTELKRAYTEELSSILDDLLSETDTPGGSVPAPGDPGASSRATTFALFGMLNWLYTWYRPDRDPPAPELAEQFAQLFLHGFLSGAPPHPPEEPTGQLSTSSQAAQPRTFF
ncbi:MAG: TetR/AcrR family transcriptional regulator [Gemmatimonadota bacterium]